MYKTSPLVLIASALGAMLLCAAAGRVSAQAASAVQAKPAVTACAKNPATGDCSTLKPAPVREVSPPKPPCKPCLTCQLERPNDTEKLACAKCRQDHLQQNCAPAK